MDGIASAQARGVEFGRKKKLGAEECHELWHKRRQGVRLKTLMDEYDLSKAIIYRYLNVEGAQA